jgi:adenine-specific DNA-methyltransferase
MNAPAFTLHHGDCMDVLRSMPDNSVDAIVTDPPYFKVKDEPWDNQWDTPAQFLAWIDTQAEQWARVLKPNGSLWVFASPQMAARVEVTIAQRFNVLNHIKWRKPAGRHLACQPADLRSFFPQTEAIIFAEHFGADNIAKGEAGYEAKCDELRGFVFEPLRAYLDGERIAAGFDRKMCDKACGNQMSGHYFSRVQWTLPTAENYKRLREAFNGAGGQYLRREYEYLRREYEDLRREYEDLRREYEDLRREYEDLRRPFSLAIGQAHTDVWDFDTVGSYDGKHPCEKPADLMRHIIESSTRPGAVVFDGFMGSGATGIAAIHSGRRFVGVEKSASHFAQASARIEMAQHMDVQSLRLLRKSAEDRDAHTVDLFGVAA